MRKMPTVTRSGQSIVAFLAVALVLASTTVSAAEPQRRDVGNDRPFAPFTFVQAGDPQMGFGPDLDHDKTMFVRLGERAKSLGASFVLVCGDLVHKGQAAEWQVFNEALGTFEVPTKLVPGNHDLSDVDTLVRYRRDYGRDYYCFAYNNCAFIGLNAMTLIAAPVGGKTESPQNARWLEESRRQWRWLEQTLSRANQARRTHVILFMHHPPFASKEDEKDAYHNWPSKTRNRLLALVRQYGVRMLLCGHTHRTFTVQPADKTFTIYSLAGTSKAFDNNGFGLRVFHVTKDGVEARVIRLDQSTR